MKNAKTTKIYALLLCASLGCLPLKADAAPAISQRAVISSNDFPTIRDIKPDQAAAFDDVSGLSLEALLKGGKVNKGTGVLGTGVNDKTARLSPEQGRVYYGEQYLQVVLEYIYLTRKKREQSSYHVTVTIGENTFKTIDFNLQEDENSFYSNVGETQIVPCVALNNPYPMYFKQEVHTLERDSLMFDLLKTVFRSAATVITGPISSSFNTIADKSGSMANALDFYEQKTIKKDYNNYNWLKNVSDAPKLPKFAVAFFSRGNNISLVERSVDDKKGYKITLLSENMLQDATLHQVTSEGDLEPEVKAYFAKKTFPKYYFEFSDNTRKYPSGKESFAILRFTLFDKYQNEILTRPEIVEETAPFFQKLDFNILGESNIQLSDEDKKALQKQVDATGKELIDKLTILTNSGTLSLKNAHELVEAFCQRASTFRRIRTEFRPEYLRTLARKFDVHEKNKLTTLEQWVDYIQKHPNIIKGGS